LKTYEAMIIFPSTLKEEVLQKSIEQIQGEITKLKGTIKETRILGKRQFARQLKKKDSGEYVRIDFQLAPESVSPLLTRFKLNETMFRIQLVAADEIPRNYSKRVSAQEDESDAIA